MLTRILNSVPNCKVIFEFSDYVHGQFEEPNKIGSWSIAYKGKQVEIVRIASDFENRALDLANALKDGGYIVKINPLLF